MSFCCGCKMLYFFVAANVTVSVENVEVVEVIGVVVAVGKDQFRWNFPSKTFDEFPLGANRKGFAFIVLYDDKRTKEVLFYKADSSQRNNTMHTRCAMRPSVQSTLKFPMTFEFCSSSFCSLVSFFFFVTFSVT